MMANSIPHSLFKHPSHDVQAGTTYSGQQKAQIKKNAFADSTHSSDSSKNDHGVSRESFQKEFPSTKNISHSDTLMTEKTSIEAHRASDNGFKDIFKHLSSKESAPQHQKIEEKRSSANQHLLQKSHHQDPWTSQKNTREKEHISILKNQKNDINSTPTMKKNDAPFFHTAKKEIITAKSESKSEGMSLKTSQKEPTETTSSRASSQPLKNQSTISSVNQHYAQQESDTSSGASCEGSHSNSIPKVRSLVLDDSDANMTSYGDVEDSVIDGDGIHFPSVLFNPFINVIQNQLQGRDTKIHPNLNSIMAENNAHDDLTVNDKTQEKRDLINHSDQHNIAPDRTDLPLTSSSSFLKTPQHNDFERNDGSLKTNDISLSGRIPSTHDMLSLSSINNSSLTTLIGRNDQTNNESNIPLMLDQHDTIQTASQDMPPKDLSSRTLNSVDDGDIEQQPQSSQNSVSELHYDEIQEKNAYPNPVISSIKGTTASQQSSEDEATTLTAISKIATKSNATAVRDIFQDVESTEAHAQNSLQYVVENGEPQRPFSELSSTIVHGSKTTHTFGSTESMAKNQMSSLRDVYMQVAQDFRDALHLRQSSFDIQLKPEGLGTVHLHIQFDKKTVEATFQVEQHALPLFLQNRDHIAEIFSSQGFNTDQNGLTFSLNQGQQHNHQRQSNTQNTSSFSVTNTDSHSNPTSQENTYPRHTISPLPDRSNTQGTFVIHV